MDEPDIANTSLRLMVELLLMPNTSVLQSDVVLTVSVLPDSTAEGAIDAYRYHKRYIHL